MLGEQSFNRAGKQGGRRAGMAMVCIPRPAADIVRTNDLGAIVTAFNADKCLIGRIGN